MAHTFKREEISTLVSLRAIHHHQLLICWRFVCGQHHRYTNLSLTSLPYLEQKSDFSSKLGFLCKWGIVGWLDSWYPCTNCAINVDRRRHLRLCQKRLFSNSKFPRLALSCALSDWKSGLQGSVCCRLLVSAGLHNLSEHNLPASPDRHTPEHAAHCQPDSPESVYGGGGGYDLFLLVCFSVNVKFCVVCNYHAL